MFWKLRSCGDDSVFTLDDSKPTYVKSIQQNVECLSISDKIVGFIDGSDTNNAFINSANKIKSIDFSNAVNLEYIGSY